MSNISYILDNKEIYEDVLKKRFFKDTELIENIQKIHSEYVAKLFEMETQKKIKNKITKIISKKYDDKDIEFIKSIGYEITDNREYYLNLSKEINQKIILLTDETQNLLKNRELLVQKVPNLLGDKTPIDINEDNNPIVKTFGESLQKGVEHHILCEKYNLIENVSEYSGHRGYVMKNDLARLNYALMNYGLDFIRSKLFTVMYVPHFLTKKYISQVCQLSEFEETLYKINSDDNNEKYLIATSEQFLTAYNSGKQITELPVKQCGISTCFRKEAGSHGKDVTGIFRVHQFEKVEQFCITDPDKSWEMMEEMIGNAEEFYQSLGLSYRIVNIVSGALNNAAAMKYDLEGWFPGSNRYRELVSCSNTLDYFSRKLNIKNKNNNYVHMLNSTLFANTRTLCCILETYQQEDHIKIPDVLIPYFGKDKIILN